LARCIEWSQSWDYASLTIINLFAYRTTSPKVLRAAVDPIVSQNDETVQRVARQASSVVVAWGNDGRREGQPDEGQEGYHAAISLAKQLAG